MKYKIIVFSFLSFLSINHINAQSEPEIVNDYFIDDWYSLAKLDGKYGVIEGYDIVVPFNYSRIEYFTDSIAGFVKAYNEKGCTIYNSEFEIVLYPDFEEATPVLVDEFGELYLFLVRKENKLGVFFEGDMVVNCEFDKINFDSENYRLNVFKNGKRGLLVLDEDYLQFKTIIPAEFDDFEFISSTHEYEYYKISNNGNSGFLIRGHTNVYLFIPNMYTITDFKSINTIALITYFKSSLNGVQGYLIVNNNSNKIIDFALNLEYVELSKQLVYQSNDFGKYGTIYTESGEIAVPAEYDKLTDLGTGYYAIRRGAKWGVISLWNQKETDVVYNNIQEIPEIYTQTD